MKIILPLPHSLTVAISGGVDSMAALDFLSANPRRKVSVAFFHHGTETSDRALEFVSEQCKQRSLFLAVGRMSSNLREGRSKQEQWRDERYRFFRTIKEQVVTAHHLDDCVESWIFWSLHGTPRTIPYASPPNVIRPFLLVKKSEMIDWCQRHGVGWEEDLTNTSMQYMRNVVRHKLMPEILKINPGIHKVVRRKVEEGLSIK